MIKTDENIEILSIRPRNKKGQFVKNIKVVQGDRFGRLVVIKEVFKEEKGRTKLLCKCDCGTFKIVKMDDLLRGKIKSCGCLKRDVLIKRLKKHGQTHSRLYRIWCNIKNRCLNPNVPNYKNYGGRGIGICDEWLEFEPFYLWAINNGYQDNLSIERIDNNSDYSPLNCKWATNSEQQLNKRTNDLVSFKGEIKPLKEWCNLYKINYEAVLLRIKRLGWSPEKALTTPIRKINKRKDV